MPSLAVQRTSQQADGDDLASEAIFSLTFVLAALVA